MRTSKTVAIAAVALLTLAGCSNDNDDNGAATSTETTSAATSSSAAASANPDLPKAADLNEVMALAVDQSAPMEERVQTIQNGETAPELFDVMAQAKQESGADFQIVDPVLRGLEPNSVLATVSFIMPDKKPTTFSNVEFVQEDGHWKLAQSWACTLLTNTVSPEQVPPMCTDATGVPAPAGEVPPAEAPAGEVPPAEAPAGEAPAAEVPPAN